MGPPSRWTILVFFVLLAAYPLAATYFQQRAEIGYSEFKKALRDGRVVEVIMGPEAIAGVMYKEGITAPAPGTFPPLAGDSKLAFRTLRVGPDDTLVPELEARGVKMLGTAPSPWGDILGTLLMLALPIGLLIYLSRRMRDAQGGMMSIGRSKAKIAVETDTKTRFGDVAGVDEAKAELEEIVDYLKHPDKYTRLGGRMPKGVLLVGPPGTGKTLLAKAVAGEAGVPFFFISGSDFVEMFVGVGAARVRDLFEQARKKAPCIVFIDELDALGKTRGTGPASHDEREQTLNQLLVELDGFDPRTAIILMGATNRPETLDPALLRAGRFDRQVLVDRPDKSGRLAILQLHAKKVPLDDIKHLEDIASLTPGFAGADLANLVNEAALLAVRRGKDVVGRDELDEAVERVIAGLEKRNRVLRPKERSIVAHHEVGHALVALSLPGADPVRKISIIPRGVGALGYTLQIPAEDRYLLTERDLLDKIAVLLGGRAAEDVTTGEISTGARDDLEKATQIARAIVTEYGMSERVGRASYARDREPGMLGAMRGGRGVEASETTSREIEQEVRRILDEQYARAQDLLRARESVLREAARVLLDKETITGEELTAIARSTAPSPVRAAG
jgi:cell division protease FtsH